MTHPRRLALIAVSAVVWVAVFLYEMLSAMERGPVPSNKTRSPHFPARWLW